MAFTGLGAGTQLDPYQITTIAQFREMYSLLNGSIHYYKLMNNLDWSNETYFGSETFTGSGTQLYFMGKLDGNNKKLTNLPTKGFGFPLYVNTSIDLKRLELRYNSPVVGNPYLFYSASGHLANATIDALKVVVEPGTSPLRSYGRFSSTSSITNISFDGEFVDCLIGRTSGLISGLIANNRHLGQCRIADLNTGSILEKFALYKPYTKVATFDANNLYMPFCAVTYGTATIRKGFLSLGNIHVVPTSTNQYGRLLYINASGGLVTTVENSYLAANMTYETPVQFCDRLAQSNGTDIFTNVHFFGNLNDGTNEQRTTMFGNGIFTNCFYDKERQGNTYDLSGQTGLETFEFIDEGVFPDWDFANIWTLGAMYPILRDAMEDYVLEYAAESIEVNVTELSITLTPHFNRYAGQYGFEVIKLSDGSTVLTVENYSGPYLFDSSPYGGVQVIAYILEGANKWRCGGDFFLDYGPAAVPGISGSNPAVAYIQLAKPENLGGGTFAGYLIEKKTDNTNWEMIANNHMEETLFQLISEKTYFRASAITQEYGVGIASSQVIVTPTTGGGGSVSGLSYKLYLGSREVALR